MGIELSEEDRRRPYVEVSGRRGLGVKADDLIDRLVEKALEEVVSRHADAAEPVQRGIATQIAVGALRYFMLRFTRTTVIAFDFQEALSFEGETGPYIQYAAVRAGNILRKLEQQGESMPDFDAELSGEALGRQLETTVFWQMLLGASRREWVIEKAVDAGEPAQLARYAFHVAQAFNNFYHQHHILSETNRERKVFPAVDDKVFSGRTGPSPRYNGHPGSGDHVVRRNFSAPHEADDRSACAQNATAERREPASLWRGPRGESWMKGEGLVPLPQSTGGNSIFIVVATGPRRSRIGLTDPRRVSSCQRHSWPEGECFPATLRGVRNIRFPGIHGSPRGLSRVPD